MITNTSNLRRIAADPTGTMTDLDRIEISKAASTIETQNVVIMKLRDALTKVEHVTGEDTGPRCKTIARIALYGRS